MRNTSFRKIFCLSIFLFFLTSVSTARVSAQTGTLPLSKQTGQLPPTTKKPPSKRPASTGGTKPPTETNPTTTLSVQVDSFDKKPLSEVGIRLEINGIRVPITISADGQGKYQVSFPSTAISPRAKNNGSNNTSELNYKVTVSKEGYAFRPDAKTTVDLKETLEFKGVPLCTTKNERQVEARVIDKLGSSDLGRIDPRTSGCQGGQYYNEYILLASQDRAFSIKIEPNKGLYFLMRSKDGKLIRNNMSEQGEVQFDSKKPLEEDGEFIIRISYPFDNPATVGELPYEYRIKTFDNGLTIEGYRKHLCTILKVESHEKLDQAVDDLLNLSSNMVIDEVIGKIEALIESAPTPEDKKKSYEILGTLYGHIYANRDLLMPDLTKAERAIKKAIELGGTIKLKITHSAYSYSTHNLSRTPSHKGGKTYWQEQEVSWLRIGKQMVMIASANRVTLYFTCGNQCDVLPSKIIVKGTEKKQPLYYLLIKDKNKFESKEVAFIPGTVFAPEKEKIIDLIHQLILDYK